MTPDAIRQHVLEAVLEVARYKNPTLTEVRPEQSLTVDLRLESLDLAQLVAELELKLGVDPFAQQAVQQVVTIADVIAVYGRALDGR